MYVIFAVWNIPVKLLGLVGDPAKLPFAVLAWSKLLLVLCFFGTATAVGRSARIISADNPEREKLAALSFLTSPIAVFAVAVLGQYDVIGLLFAMGETAPAPVRQVASGLVYRDFITVGILVKRLRVANRTAVPTVGNIIPDLWIYIQERDVKVGRIQIFNNWSPYLVRDPETVWIGLEYFASQGDALDTMTPNSAAP